MRNNIEAATTAVSAPVLTSVTSRLQSLANLTNSLVTKAEQVELALIGSPLKGQSVGNGDNDIPKSPSHHQKLVDIADDFETSLYRLEGLLNRIHNEI